MAQLKEGSVIKKVGGDEVIATTNDIPDIPDDAKFTDTNTTYAEITTAEIDAGTASTLRTISARRIKYILDKYVESTRTITSATEPTLAVGDQWHKEI